MKIRVDDIKDKVILLEADQLATEFAHLLALETTEECKFLAPVHYALSVVREYDHIRVTGSIKTEVRQSCSRCLAESVSLLESLFTLIYTKASKMPQDEEIELGEEDLIAVSYEGDEIDFAPVIEEQVLLEVPLKPLCQEDCQGLCTNCGTNLNTASCECNRFETNLKMSALSKLRLVK